MSSLNMVAFGTVVSFLVRKDPVLNGQDFLLVKHLGRLGFGILKNHVSRK